MSCFLRRRKRKEEMQNKGSSSQIEVDVTTPVTPTTPTPVMPPSGTSSCNINLYSVNCDLKKEFVKMTEAELTGM